MLCKELFTIMDRIHPLIIRASRFGLENCSHAFQLLGGRRKRNYRCLDWASHRPHGQCMLMLPVTLMPGSEHPVVQLRSKSSLASKSNADNPLKSTPSQDSDTYAVAKITPLTTAMPNSPRSLKITTKNLSIEQILEEAPGTHARDFFSLSLTSIGEAESRKRRARFSANKIHPWFVLPRETEIIVSSYCNTDAY